MSQNWETTPRLPVPWGEVFDKLTILSIKLKKLSDPDKLRNISKEHEAISNVIGDVSRFPSELASLCAELEAINLRLWDVEDGKRECERMQDFGPDFIALAREVYFGNDKRAAIKRRINELLGSSLLEEKSYRAY